MIIEPIHIGVVCRTCKQPITTRDRALAVAFAKLPAELQTLMQCHKCGWGERHTVETTPRQVDYHAYIQSDAWRIKATQAKERAGWRCQICNGTERLQTHHRSYERLGNELPEDLTALCDECHELFSREGKLK